MLEQVSLMLKLHQDIPDLIMAEDLTSYFSPALQRINLDNFAEIFDPTKKGRQFYRKVSKHKKGNQI